VSICEFSKEQQDIGRRRGVHVRTRAAVNGEQLGADVKSGAQRVAVNGRQPGH
jgi:hypothetical protein